MPTRIRVAVTLLLLLFADGRAFCRPSVAGVLVVTGRTNSPRTWIRDPIVFMQQPASSESTTNNIPQWVYGLNVSTKWWVTMAATWGIWSRFPSYHGPFIVVGAIASVYSTDVLKQIMNHDRPAGSPLNDPGMPSSHSLVSFFMASAWVTTAWFLPAATANTWKSLLLLTGASTVAWLRVLTGYHSLDQITVGAVLGCLGGGAWAKVGTWLVQSFPATTVRVSWGLYFLASAFFALKNMRAWLLHEKHF